MGLMSFIHWGHLVWVYRSCLETEVCCVSYCVGPSVAAPSCPSAGIFSRMARMMELWTILLYRTRDEETWKRKRTRRNQRFGIIKCQVRRRRRMHYGELMWSFFSSIKPWSVDSLDGGFFMWQFGPVGRWSNKKILATLILFLPSREAKMKKKSNFIFLSGVFSLHGRSAIQLITWPWFDGRWIVRMKQTAFQPVASCHSASVPGYMTIHGKRGQNSGEKLHSQDSWKFSTIGIV